MSAGPGGNLGGGPPRRADLPSSVSRAFSVRRSSGRRRTSTPRSLSSAPRRTKARRSCPARALARGRCASTRCGSCPRRRAIRPEPGPVLLRREMHEGLIVDLGDADIIPTNIVSSFDSITALTARVLSRGAVPIVLGGDHAISFPVVRAFERELLRRALRRPPRLRALRARDVDDQPARLPPHRPHGPRPQA